MDMFAAAEERGIVVGAIRVIVLLPGAFPIRKLAIESLSANAALAPVRPFTHHSYKGQKRSDLGDVAGSPDLRGVHREQKPTTVGIVISAKPVWGHLNEDGFDCF